MPISPTKLQFPEGGGLGECPLASIISMNWASSRNLPNPTSSTSPPSYPYLATVQPSIRTAWTTHGKWRFSGAEWWQFDSLCVVVILHRRNNFSFVKYPRTRWALLWREHCSDEFEGSFKIFWEQESCKCCAVLTGTYTRLAEAERSIKWRNGQAVMPLLHIFTEVAVFKLYCSDVILISFRFWGEMFASMRDALWVEKRFVQLFQSLRIHQQSWGCEPAFRLEDEFQKSWFMIMDVKGIRRGRVFWY